MTTVRDYVELGALVVLGAPTVIKQTANALGHALGAFRALKAPTSLAALQADVADIKTGLGWVGIAVSDVKPLAEQVIKQPIPANL